MAQASYRTISALTSERSCLRQLERSSARTTLTKPTSNVILGPLVDGLGEQLRRGSELHQLTEQEKPGRVGHPRRLLHVVRDDHDGEIALELEDQLLDARGGDRIERRAARGRCRGAAAGPPTGQRPACPGGPSLPPTGRRRAAPARRARSARRDHARRPGAVRRPRCRRSSWSETDWASGTPCRYAAAPRRDRLRGFRCPAPPAGRSRRRGRPAPLRACGSGSG